MPDAIDFTEIELRRFSPRMLDGFRQGLLRGKGTLQEAGILDSGMRLSHFMGQFGGETAGGTLNRENLNYTTVASIRGAWRARASKHSDEWIKANLLRNPVAIGDWAYGGRMGNRKGTSDGYDFRGGGYLQTTGRGHVADLCTACTIPIRPDILDDFDATLKFACAEWKSSGCNELADANDLMGISKAINTGSATSNVVPNGVPHRQAWFDKAKDIWWDAEPGGAVLPAPKEAHLEAHAVLKEASTSYSLKHKAIAALGNVTTVGGTVTAAVAGAVNSAEQITLTATGLMNQVGATAQLITRYGLPFLGLSLMVAMGIEVLQFYQRKMLTDKPG